MIQPSGRIPRLLERLADRPDLGRVEAIEQFWSGLPLEPLKELFDLIVLELGFSAGLLRPNDSLEALLAPLTVRNPLKWAFEESALEDGVSEINFQLKRRGLTNRPTPFRTVNELVTAWCHAG